MTIKHTIKTALKGLQTNRSRSVLTILGIVIGIGAIIILMSLGQGAQNLIVGQLQGLGSKTLVVVAGRQPKGPSDFAQILSDSLKQKDLEALNKKINVPYASRVVPVVFGPESGVYENETYRLTIFGAAPEISQILNLYPSQGTIFTDEDVQSRADVAIIGSKVKEELFGDSDAIGQRIRIKDRTYRIIGVLSSKGQLNFFNFDEIVLMPYTTAQSYVLGIKYFHRFMIEATSENLIDQTKKDIETTIRENHNITDPDKDDFHVETQVDLVQRLGTITDVLTLFLVAVAAVSLIVGGIGIMNIMLVSVSERTHEIGLRKAIGATDGDVLRQFLFEAVILTGLGGIIGVAAGVFFSFVSSVILSGVVGLNWQFTFPFTAAILGLIVSTIVGLTFGLYPARQASKKSPIEALRYE